MNSDPFRRESILEIRPLKPIFADNLEKKRTLWFFPAPPSFISNRSLLILLHIWHFHFYARNHMSTIDFMVRITGRRVESELFFFSCHASEISSFDTGCLIPHRFSSRNSISCSRLKQSSLSGCYFHRLKTDIFFVNAEILCFIIKLPSKVTINGFELLLRTVWCDGFKFLSRDPQGKWQSISSN